MAEERVRIALEALAEFTRPGDVGELISETDEGEGVTTLAFRAAMLGYPGWQWTVSIAEIDGAAPTVLEAELLPGEGALLAPDWVPWSERLEEYRAAQAAAAAEAAANGEDLDDESEDDESDEDEDLADVRDADDDFGDDPDDGIEFEEEVPSDDDDSDDDDADDEDSEDDDSEDDDSDDDSDDEDEDDDSDDSDDDED